MSKTSSKSPVRVFVTVIVALIFCVSVGVFMKDLLRVDSDAPKNDDDDSSNKQQQSSYNPHISKNYNNNVQVPAAQQQQQKRPVVPVAANNPPPAAPNNNRPPHLPPPFKRLSNEGQSVNLPEESTRRRHVGTRFDRRPPPPPPPGMPRPGRNRFDSREDREKRREQDEMRVSAANVRVPSDPVKCRKSSSLLENSPTITKKYGTVAEGGWCEMTTQPATDLSGIHPEDVQFRSLDYDTLRNNGKSHHIQNGSTWLDYRSSSDGNNWPYYQCPAKHTIRCHTDKLRENNGNNGRKLYKSKALVIFVVSSASRSLQQHHETSNLIYFLEHGLVPGKTETALFDEVDYVFAKVQISGEATDTRFVDCGSFEEAKLIQDKVHEHHRKRNRDNVHPPNIRFIMIPKSSCDICAHAKVLDHLGIFNWKKETDRHREVIRGTNSDIIHDPGLIFRDEKWDNHQPVNDSNPYSQIFMFNSGTRGPFFVNDDDSSAKNDGSRPMTTWLDYIAMGGRNKIPNPRLGFFHHPLVRAGKESDQDECPIHVASSVSISWEQKMHLQTFFLAAPIELMRTRIFSLFVNSCNGDKIYCIMKGEVESARMTIDYSSITAVHSLGKQFHVRDTSGPESRAKRDRFFVPPRNPCYSWYDPCKAIFVKNGGHLAHDGKPLQRILVDALDRLTKGVTMKGQSDATTRFEYSDFMAVERMLDEKKCQWDF